MRRLIRDYLIFHKRERNGIFILLGLIIIFSLLNFFWFNLFPSKSSVTQAQFNQFVKSIDSANNQTITNKKEINENYASIKMEVVSNNSDEEESIIKEPVNYFTFNPNTATKEDFVALGLPDKLVNSIENFRNKGGKFYKPEDFSKIYNLSSELYHNLLPFILIPVDSLQQKFEKHSYHRFEPQDKAFDINAADTLMFQNLKGIGPSLARRIVKLRDNLGGFYKKEQLMEVWGLDTTVYQLILPYLKIVTPVRQININTVELYKLKSHPYIKYHVANSIIAMRGRLGAYKNIEEVKKSDLISNELFEKIKPYLKVN